jgi:hypothetical protein
MTESTDKATHRTYPSLAFASVSMKSFECRVIIFYATAANFRSGVGSSLISL